MKVRAELHVNFRDKNALYQALKKDKSLTINLNYAIGNLVFGKFSEHDKLWRYLMRYGINKYEDLNADRYVKHNNGNFVVKYNLHVFPIEFKSDITGTQVDSYQFSAVKKFKPISSGNPITPDITF